VPIKWSAVKVSEAIDELDQLVDALGLTLWQVREKAQELRQIPNIPGYIDQPANSMFWKVANFYEYLKGYIERIIVVITAGDAK
jgi:hypothetical protein